MNSIVDDFFVSRAEKWDIKCTKNPTYQQNLVSASQALLDCLTNEQKKFFFAMEDLQTQEKAEMEERAYRYGLHDGILLVCEALYTKQ